MDHLPEGNPDGMRSSSGAHGVDPVETGVDAGTVKFGVLSGARVQSAAFVLRRVSLASSTTLRRCARARQIVRLAPSGRLLRQSSPFRQPPPAVAHAPFQLVSAANSGEPTA
ncbi:hypothetical protein HPB51_007669 [Rhipicephalus microplus]|uniref:Uncharacterized protein n=1 Tax=Rhipicephalus microplus TaxID=6941 RepID=A0A9J6D8V9_RHIMP|nr:hypothetical protein HPB51_007669 [Rhipicephalus microplus]